MNGKLIALYMVMVGRVSRCACCWESALPTSECLLWYSYKSPEQLKA